MNWATETMGHVDELAEVAGSVPKAIRLLEKLKVPVVDGVFLRQALVEALGGRSLGSALSQSDADPLKVLQDELAPYGVQITRSRPGRSTTVWLTAAKKRLFGAAWCFDEEARDGGDLWATVGRDEVPARVYSLTKPRTGSPQFSVGGLNDPRAPKIYFLVAPHERRVWSLNRLELASIEEMLREPEDAGKKSKDSDDELPEKSFALHTNRKGSLRVWVPRKTETDFDLALRIHSGNKKLVRSLSAPEPSQ